MNHSSSSGSGHVADKGECELQFVDWLAFLRREQPVQESSLIINEQRHYDEIAMVMVIVIKLVHISSDWIASQEVSDGLQYSPPPLRHETRAQLLNIIRRQDGTVVGKRDLVGDERGLDGVLGLEDAVELLESAVLGCETVSMTDTM